MKAGKPESLKAGKLEKPASRESVNPGNLAPGIQVTAQWK